MDNETQRQEFRAIFLRLLNFGKLSTPRGLKVLEVENFNYELSPYVRFCNFKSRKLNLNYIKQEFLWYLRGNKFDLEILKHAKLWKGLVNDDGSINSNYGQYIFGANGQFNNVVKILREDKDSRRASIMILSKEHLTMKTNDVPCTYSINFRIREDKLNMTVRMRSQDAIFGMANDCPTFSFIHEMMFKVLKEDYPKLEYGRYYHSADSFHAYERHFELLQKLVNDEFNIIHIPTILNKTEVDFLMKNDFKEIPKEYKFTSWLNDK